MIHDEHGATHAYSQHEADELAKQGWRIDVQTPAQPEVADTAPAGIEAGPTVASVRAELEALGIAYDRRWGLDRLLSLKG